jgi:hypothetical protein
MNQAEISLSGPLPVQDAAISLNQASWAWREEIMERKAFLTE